MENMETEYNLPRIIFNIKNIIFIFCLLFSSFLNCNFLYFNYILLGFILSFFLFRNKNPKIYYFRQVSELLIMIYSILLLAFKITFIIFIKQEIGWVKSYKNLFINLGIKLLKDEESTFNLVSSFLSESIIIIVSLVSFIISVTFEDFKLDANPQNKKMTRNDMFNLLIKYLIINYFIFLFLAIFNTSILTLIYLSLIGIALFFAVKKNDFNKMLFVYRAIILINYGLLIIQIFFINMLNCYTFEDILTEKIIDTGTKIKYYSVFSKIGIKIMVKYDTSTEISIQNLSYFFNIVALLSIAASNYKFRFYINLVRFIENNEIQEKKNIKTSFFNKIKLKIKSFFTSPNFILHICRLLAIGYLYFFRNFFGFIVFIWLFLSFLFLRARSNKVTTFIVLFFLFISHILFHISNIDGLFEKEEIYYYHLSMDKTKEYSDYYIKYFGLNLLIFFEIIFLFSLYNIDLSSMDNEKNILQIKKESEEQNPMDISDYINDSTKKNLISNDNDKIRDKEDEFEKNKEDEKIEKLNEKKVTFQIISKNSNGENILRKSKISKDTLKKLSILNIILKGILSHIDIISLIAMYFICINLINITHFILVAIFMIQLLFPDLVNYISKYLIIAIQLLFLGEFVLDILKHYYLVLFNQKEKLIKLFINYDTNPSETSVEIYFYVLVYCFYIQYKLYTHEFYTKVISNEKVTLRNYILYKFHSHPYIRNILFFIGKIITEIYIWILIVLFVFFDTYFEISVLFEIKLILFFIIVFQFLISVQNPENNYISLILNWIFLIYCSFNSFLVYGYQVIYLDYFNEKSDSESQNFFVKNLPSIGFSFYKEKLHYKFLPHFICNFVSVLFLWEMERILLNSHKIENFNEFNGEIIIEENKDKIEKKEELGATEMYQQNKSRMTTLDFFYYLYSIVLLITKFYWLFLLIYLGIIFTSHNLSVFVIIYILIFGLIYVRMFYRIITKLNNYIQKQSFFISRLIRYNLIELKRHEQQNKYFRMKGFEYLLTSCLLFYLFYYTFGIFHQVQNGCNYENNHGKYGWKDCDNRHEKIINDEDNIFSCVAYFIGFYSECDYIFEKSWFHLVFALLISFDVYILKFENYINEKRKENREEYKNLANQNIQLKSLTLGEKNVLMNITHYLNKIKNDSSEENLINENEEVKKNENEEEIEKIKTSNENYFSKLKEIRKSGISKNKSKKILFKIDTKNLEEDKRIGKKLLEDFKKIFDNSNKHNDVKLSSNKNIFEIVEVTKNVFEELIIFFLICTLISKMSIWSFIYMIISLILIKTKRTMIKFYRLYCFLFVSTLIQTILFVSNIQKSTEPNPDLELLRELRKKFNIPWYNNGIFNIDTKIGFFRGLGVTKSQINLIWMEFVEIILIFLLRLFFL